MSKNLNQIILRLIAFKYSFMILSKIFIFALFAVINCKYMADPDPPIWPDHFSMFVMEHPGALLSVSVTAPFWVDYKANLFRIDRNDSNYEPSCQSVLPNASTPCTHIFNNGTKFLIFPEKSLCCKCCQQGSPKCDYVKQDWLKNAVYTGQSIVRWQRFSRWEIKIQGKLAVYLESTDLIKIPYEIASDQIPYLAYFAASTYNTTDIPTKVFQIPSIYNSCSQPCPASVYCSNEKETNILQQ